MIRSKGLRLLAVVAIAALGFIVVAVVITMDHWWIRSRGVVVTCTSGMCATARVYQSRRGDILVATDDYDWYIVLRDERLIGMANRSNFLRLPGCVYSRNAPPLFALMNSVKSVNPDLLVEGGRIEFNSLNEGRVRLIWSR
jgi:hypothetical protein